MLNNVLRGITVQSIRPVGGGGGGWNPNPPANDQVARGNFAEFHTQPSERNYRVLACTRGSATANCAAQTADNWCRSIGWNRSEEHTSELQSLMRISYAVFCLKKKNNKYNKEQDMNEQQYKRVVDKISQQHTHTT